MDAFIPTMKLDPDIVTLGKIVGGGMAIGVMCGKKEIMEFADTTWKEKIREVLCWRRNIFCKSSLNGDRICNTLSSLKSKKSIYSKINDLGEFARKEISKAFDGKVAVTGKGSLFMTHFLQNGISEITNSTQASKCDTQMLHKYHFKMISHDGIFFLPGKLGAISDAHSKEDIKKIIKASEEF